MNIDDIVKSIPEEDEDLRSDLQHWIDEWKSSDASIDDLANLVGKWHGNVWFKSQSASNKFYEQWQKFKSTAIDGIGGLTVNECLYWFGLFDIWDQANEDGQEKLRAKIRANT